MMLAGSSVQAQPKPCAAATKSVRNWRPFSSKTGAFSVRMPATPKSAVRGEGKQKVHAFFHAVAGGAYLVTYGDLREGGFSARKIKMLNAESMLDSNRDGVISGSQATLVSESRLKWQGFPAREIVYDIPQLQVRGRSLLVYARPFMYQVSALMPKAKASTPTVRGFIDSFRTSTPRS